TPAFFKLVWVEFRRQWTGTALMVPLLVLLIGSLMVFFPGPMNRTFNVGEKLYQLMILLVPFASAFFCVGLVSNDVKDGWLRTLLVRAIRREEYLLAKSLSALTSIWVTVLFAGTLPLVVGLILTKLPIEFQVGEVLATYALFFCVSLLYVSILTFFSCWLPGIVNVVALMGWGIVASSLRAYVNFFLWDSSWAVFAEQFLFPSGFFDAVDAVRAQTHTPYAEIVWGMAALAFFSSLSFWSVNRIQGDKGSE
ncbi:MAG: ABC transporter permease subunit, partial [Bacteroidota bacterium]